MKSTFFAVGFLALILASRVVSADAPPLPCPNDLQCYSSWQFNNLNEYWECWYYFRTSKEKQTFQLHQLVYIPGQNWIYYYNPAAGNDREGRVWCRAYVGGDAKGLVPDGAWLVLKEVGTKPDLSESARTIGNIASAGDMDELKKALNDPNRLTHPTIPKTESSEPDVRMMTPPRLPPEALDPQKDA